MYSMIRHESIFRPEQALPVFIIGCGATGSHLALALFSMGITRDIHVIDFDTVEPHNFPNQIFLQEHLAKFKVDAMKEYIGLKMGDFANDISRLAFINGKVPEHSITSIPLPKDKTPVVILAVDTMEARIDIVDHLRADTRRDDWHVIDPRMAASHGNVFSFKLKTHYQHWVDTLIPDDQAETSPCGAPISCLPTTFGASAWTLWEYINLCVDPLASTDIIDFYFKPPAVSFRRWPK